MKSKSSRIRVVSVHSGLALLLIVCCWLPATAQRTSDPMGPPDPIPDPLPRKPRERPGRTTEDGRDRPPVWEELHRESELDWGLPPEMARSLGDKARVYKEFARKFSCTETARSAKYQSGEAGKEKRRRYSYLLVVRPEDGSLEESRKKLKSNGKVSKDAIKDEEAFPPAYAWVFLFSEFNQGFFAYRDLGDYFDGFDWVREIQFKGSLRFSDGQDIREWEGIALVDAATLTPIEIRADPIGQRDHIRALYRKWMTAFSLAGFKFAPKPFGYRCQVNFRTRKAGLTFPTALRYDTFRAVSQVQAIPWMASTRNYTEYRFFNVGTTETIGEEAAGNQESGK
jgi:hypothetical protein